MDQTQLALSEHLMMNLSKVVMFDVMCCRCSGEPTVCTKDSATVTLAGCLLQDKGIDYSVLHLNDPSCKGRMDNQTHMVTFSFDSSNACGTNVSVGSVL